MRGRRGTPPRVPLPELRVLDDKERRVQPLERPRLGRCPQRDQPQRVGRDDGATWHDWLRAEQRPVGPDRQPRITPCRAHADATAASSQRRHTVPDGLCGLQSSSSDTPCRSVSSHLRSISYRPRPGSAGTCGTSTRPLPASCNGAYGVISSTRSPGAVHASARSRSW